MEIKGKKRGNRKKTATIKLASQEIGIELQKKYFDEDNNYIDYFLEIGAKPEIFKYNYLYDSETLEDINDNLIPQIICKFPNFDKKNIVLDNGILSQIFPHGFNVIESKSIPEPHFFCLTLDNQLFSMIYTTKYLACLIIYENVENYKQLYDTYKQLDTQFSSSIIGLIKKNVQEEKKIKNLKYKNYYIPKCLCLASVHPYITKFEEILRTIYDLTLQNRCTSLFLDNLIEKLILETPKVPKGYKKIILEFPNKQIDITENKMNELPQININLINTFDILSVGTIIEIFKYLFFETKMIFFSKDLYNLTNTILSFLSLLSPFKYQFQVISILPKDFYGYIETISPYIFGINQVYTDKFFKDNKIEISETTICIVDIDNDKCFIAPSNNNEHFPEMPKKISKKLEMKINECNSDFKKNKEYLKSICDLKKIVANKNKIKGIYLTYSIKEMNEKYQLCFYKCMINMLIDYPKFLTKDYSVNKDISMCIQDMIDINGYLNSFSSNERPFYSKIFNTQLFIEFIYKRMMPKDCNEKVEVLFFEEKINEKIASKNLFNKAKLKSQNILLYCKDYDYDKEIQYLNFKDNIKLSNALLHYIYNRKEILTNDFLYKGYKVDINEAKNQIIFNYILFPSLISEKFFILKADSYQSPINYNKQIDDINTKIVNKSYLKFIQKAKDLKNTEEENDLYICYIIIWSLVFWYNDDIEREIRFIQMVKILEKIEEHDIKTFEQLFKALVEYSNDENVIIIYKKFIHLRLNPSWEIFSLVSKIIKKKQNVNKKNLLLLQETKACDLNEIFIKENRMEKIAQIRDRVLLFQDRDDNIFSSNVLYYAYLKCDKCKSTINLKELCTNLSLLTFEKDNNDRQRIRCRNKNKNIVCNSFYNPFIKIHFGKELYNKKAICNNYSKSIYNKIRTSSVGEIVFMSPDEIKKQLLSICTNLKKDIKFDVEYFRFNYPDIFWNLILYFEFNNIDITFMLPYSPYTDKKIKEKVESDIKKHVNYKKENIVSPNKNDNEYIFDFVNNDNNDNNNNNNNNNNFDNNNKFKDCIKMFRNRIKIKYNNDDLCMQNAYNFEISDNDGMISYKNIFSFEDNIGFNELPMIAPERDNYSTLSDSISQFNNDELPSIEEKKKHKRNLSSSVIDSITCTKLRLGPNATLNKKNTIKEKSVEKTCFEFEDSEDYSDDSDNKK